MTDDIRKGLPSASGIERLALCPASWRAEKACPQEDPSKDAMEGIMLHKHMERGTTPEDAEHAEAVEWCRKTEVELAQELLGGEPEKCFREQRLWLDDDVTGEKLLSGCADVVFARGDKVLIVDYKFGRGDVAKASGNYQLATLAVLVSDNARDDLEEVYCAILQPFVSRKRPQIVKYTEKSLVTAHNTIVNCLNFASKNDAPFHPSANACKYCRASMTCPAIKRDLVAASTSDLVTSWESLTPSQKMDAYKAAKQASAWAKKVNEKIKSDLKAGIAIEGLHLGQGKKAFTITDPSKAFSLLADNLGMSAADFAACCKVGITKLDKAVHAARKAQGKTTVNASREWLRATVADCSSIEESEGAITEDKNKKLN